MGGHKGSRSGQEEGGWPGCAQGVSSSLQYSMRGMGEVIFKGEHKLHTCYYELMQKD